MAKITDDMTIGDILQTFSESSQKLIVLMESYGLHCVGCHANAFESLRQGVLGHGLGEDVLQELVEKLNGVLDQRATVQDQKESFQISFSDAAIHQVKRLLSEQEDPDQGLHLSVRSGGCAGASYQIDFAKNPKKDDVVLKKKGLCIFIPKENLSLLNGLEVDYKKTLMESSFKFNNPNATGTCGCGTSFDFEG